MLRINRNRLFPAVILVGLIMAAAASAMPPHPLQYEQGKAAGKFAAHQSYYDTRADEVARGVNAPSVLNSPMQPDVSGTFRILTVLVTFSDQPYTVAPEFFDTLIYGSSIGNVHHYYDNVSYSQLDLITVELPSDLGWTDAPQSYSYYVNGDRGTGSYPQNTQKLCEDIAAIIDSFVDFSQYDNNSDGYVDGLILVHTGTGYEYSGDVNDIHSHKWSTSSPQFYDGVYVFEYCIQPEYWTSAGDMTCGVFCHELGHIFGLPDLYDTDYSSRGVGMWSIMASGSWLGPGFNGSRPSEPDAWSRVELGFKTAVNVTSNSNNVSIASIEGGGPIYRLWNSGTIGSEYFLVENRQQTGYGAYLPGSGLLIWHIDETQLSGYTVNDNEWYPGHTSSGNYAVALEQADGLYDMEQLVNSGNGGDPFPGTTGNTAFNTLTSPNSNDYDDAQTYVAVNNISTSGPTMTADLQVSLVLDVDNDNDGVLPEYFRLEQNYPNPFNPTTNIRLSLPRDGQVIVNIYDLLGRKVILLSDEYRAAGEITITWDGRDKSGQEVPSGIYFYDVITEQGRDSGKMTLVR